MPPCTRTTPKLELGYIKNISHVPKNVIAKYLQSYAEPEAKEALACLAPLFKNSKLKNSNLKKNNFFAKHTICLPCYAEDIDHLIRLLTFIGTQKNILTIIVLNQPDSLDEGTCHSRQQQNQAWINYLKDKEKIQSKCIFENQKFNLFNFNSNLILFIDRFSVEPIPLKQGVGLARKIGADVALQLYDQNFIHSKWLHNTDADIVIERNYFHSIEPVETEPFETQNAAAVVYPFKHIDDKKAPVKLNSSDRIYAATALYEQRLHQYVDGLRSAGSAYAYHTIGSCIALSLDHYAQVRGFPKQSAGEDFYLLNKLRKLGEVISLDSPSVGIFARESDRAPYGTGAAVNDILLHDNIEDAEIFYHPSTFIGLSIFIDWLKTLGELEWNKILAEWKNELRTYAKLKLKSDTDPYLKSEAIVTAVESIDFEQGLNHCVKQSKSKEAFDHQMLCWFDGFKTLKLVHGIRDECSLGAVKIKDLPRYSLEKENA